MLHNYGWEKQQTLRTNGSRPKKKSVEIAKLNTKNIYNELLYF